ncbi:MAG TPA: amino acid decarboxylase, partial [Ruminococcaceae bacterium]|nr:amino acid decarboxylase [Oscillospiraceae bacterium]
MNTPICNFLEKYAGENRLRLHMPGHDGEFPHDITEIYGADNLFSSDVSGGIIGTSEALAAGVFGAKKTCYSCAGSTLAIQTALAILKSQGCKRIAASRYSHRSLVSAAALLQLDVKWLYPSEYMSADVTYDSAAITGVDAVFITNIDYYGGTWK